MKALLIIGGWVCIYGALVTSWEAMAYLLAGLMLHTLAKSKDKDDS